MNIDRYGMGFGLVGLLGMVIWLAMIVLFIALLVLAVRWFIRAEHGRTPGSQAASSQPAPPAGRDPLEILRERYARGEIDEDEFERRRRTLAG